MTSPSAPTAVGCRPPVATIRPASGDGVTGEPRFDVPANRHPSSGPKLNRARRAPPGTARQRWAGLPVSRNDSHRGRPSETWPSPSGRPSSSPRPPQSYSRPVVTRADGKTGDFSLLRPGITLPACAPGRGRGTSGARASGDGPWPGTVAARQTSPRLPAGPAPRRAAAARHASDGRPRLRCP